MAKLTDKTVYSGTLDDADVVHVVDVSDTTQDPAGSSYKLTLIYFYTWILSKLSSVFEPKITAGLMSDFWIGNKTWANIRSTVYAQLLAGGYAPTAGTVTNGDSLTQVIQKLDGNDALKELLANKSNSYTVSSTTTYANTKALVDGLATKGDVTLTGTQTLTNKRITTRVYSAANNTSLTPEKDTYDIFHLTAMSAATTINNPSTTTPADGDKIQIRFLDNGTARALTWGTVYVAKGGISLPSTTVLSKNLMVGFEYNSNLAKWNLIASAQES